MCKWSVKHLNCHVIHYPLSGLIIVSPSNMNITFLSIVSHAWSPVLSMNDSPKYQVSRIPTVFVTYIITQKAILHFKLYASKIKTPIQSYNLWFRRNIFSFFCTLPSIVALHFIRSDQSSTVVENMNALSNSFASQPGRISR